MDDLRVGTILRAARRRRDLRQKDVAALASVSQGAVSFAERGHLERLRLATLRRIGKALDVTLEIAPRWRGEELARLADEGHAALVEAIVRILRAAGWEILVEYSFNRYGERGAVDIVAWDATHRALLLVEVKVRLVDVQETLATFGRKIRIVPRLVAAERGWRPLSVGRLVVVADSTTNRDRVRRHAATLATAFPRGSIDARRWLRSPQGDLAAIWFLRDGQARRPAGRPGGSRRVRRGAPRTGADAHATNHGERGMAGRPPSP